MRIVFNFPQKCPLLRKSVPVYLSIYTKIINDVALKIVSSLLPSNKPACGKACRPSFSRVNSDTIGCMWAGEFDLKTLRVDGKVLNPEERVTDSKITGYVWTGL